MRTIIRNTTVVTMDDADTILHDAAIAIADDGRIEAVGPDASIARTGDVRIIDGSGQVVIPGFVQTHIHLCQTLFRNLADDLVLIDWLRTRIWPFEAAHDAKSLRASARLGLAELIRSGTTCILDMGTVNHTDAIGEAMLESGLRGFVGKCMMDAGDEVPPGLRESTRDSLRESERLARAWRGAGDGRIGYCFAPRFALSCTETLLREVGPMAADLGALIHTHSSETQFEVDTTLRDHGVRNVEYLERCGLTGDNAVFAHGVWLDDNERRILRDSCTAIAHCPSSNLKLASGIADIPRLLEWGIKVGLGADGAPCSNTLDAFTEMRHAALIQKPIHGPTAMPARRVLRLATIDGARALGLGDQIGSIEVGKRADLSIIRFDRPHNGVGGDIASRLVYASYPENVRTVLVDGRILMEDGVLTTLDEPTVIEDAARQLELLTARA